MVSQHTLAPRHALPYFPRRQGSNPVVARHPRSLLKLPAWRGVAAWLCGSWCQGFQPMQRALTQPTPATLPCRQHGEVSQEDELVVVLGTQSTWESPRLGSWGQGGQEQAVMVVRVIAQSMSAEGWCV